MYDEFLKHGKIVISPKEMLLEAEKKLHSGHLNYKDEYEDMIKSIKNDKYIFMYHTSD